MLDPRVKKLAYNLINYSCSVKPGERVLIESTGFELPLSKELIRETYKAGGIPFVTIKNDELKRVLLKDCSEEQMKMLASYELARMKDMNAYIGMWTIENANELCDVPEDKIKLYSEFYRKPVHFEQRLNNTKWVLLRCPTSSAAQAAGMSTEAFEDFYFDVCNMDYANMSRAMDGLVKLIERTDKVRVKGKGTDLTFSIKGMTAIKCDGGINIPDGEVYTAPVKNSVNGYISFNIPSKYQEGFTYNDIYLEFKDGRIIKAVSNNIERINKLLDTDDGARYVGEFAFGVNPHIKNPMIDTLFDEKIMGSIHLTPGSCYKNCDNGNESLIHWDLVLIQTQEFGGGEIWFDNKLVRKDGIFVHEDLECLNPSKLI
jgi:Leucyl aminopeptidase (aminopeptidase T)